MTSIGPYRTVYKVKGGQLSFFRVAARLFVLAQRWRENGAWVSYGEVDFFVQ